MCGVIHGPRVLKCKNYICQDNFFTHLPKCASNFILNFVFPPCVVQVDITSYRTSVDEESLTVNHTANLRTKRNTSSGITSVDSKKSTFSLEDLSFVTVIMCMPIFVSSQPGHGLLCAQGLPQLSLYSLDLQNLARLANHLVCVGVVITWVFQKFCPNGSLSVFPLGWCGPLPPIDL